MRLPPLALGAILVLLAAASPGEARWSAPMMISATAGTTTTASDLAVNPRGDVAIAWAARDDRSARTVVRVTAVTAGGRVITHRLWLSRRRLVRDISVGIDQRGEITTAWGSAPGIRTAHGSLSRPWAAPQALKGVGWPRVAVGPRGEVLLVWGTTPGPITDGISEYVIGYAWRNAGGRFGSARLLKRPRLWMGDYTSDTLTPVIDGRGNAYIFNQCQPTLRIAPRGSHRFGRPVVLARVHAIGLSLAVGANGTGLVSWAAGGCTADAAAGPTFGRVFVAPIGDGRIGTPQGLPYTTQAGGTVAIATPRHTVGIVTWNQPYGTGPQLFSMPVTLGAWPAKALAVAQASAPLAADGAGDLVLGYVVPGQQHVFGGGPVATRPVGGGPDEPSPLGPAVGVIATAPGLDGRRVAALAGVPVTDPAAPALRVSVWEP